MLEPKFKIGQTVYMVFDVQMLKGKIVENCIRINKDSEYVECTFEFIAPGKPGEPNVKKQKCLRECYFIETFEDAKSILMVNADVKIKALQNGLENLKEEDFDIEEYETEEMYHKRMKSETKNA